MTEKQTKKAEPTFEEEVEAFLNMDPKERQQQAMRSMAETIVRHNRKKRGIDDERSESA